MNIEALYEQHADDPRPLPLIIASLWSFPLATSEGDGVLFYAVQDWIAGLADCDSRKASVMWNKMQAAELSISIRQLPYTASNGKTYTMGYTDDKGLYAIAAHMRATKDRPALAAIKRYLALAGVFADEVRRDPSKGFDAALSLYQRRGKDDAWIESRLEGKIARRAFTDALNAAVSEALTGQHYKQATDDVYAGLWHRTTAQLKRELGLSKSQSLRDHQPAVALMYQRIAEAVIAQQLGSADSVTWDEAERIIRAVAALIGSQAADTGALLGIDLATGKPLLP